MRDLRSGERLDLFAGPHSIRLAAADRDLDQSVGLVIVPVDDQGEAIPSFAPLHAGDHSHRAGVTVNGRGRLDLDLRLLPSSVDRLLFVVYLTTGAGFGETLARSGALSIRIGDTASFRLDMTARDDTATILVEFYKRQGGWRVSANGQGFAFGVSAVSRALKIPLDVGDAYAGARASGGAQEERRQFDDRGPTSGDAGSGSAFAISPRLLLTNHHVVEHASRMTATGASGSGACDLVLADPVNDIALLRIHHDAASFARFRPDAEADLGEDVMVAGFPLQGLLGTGPQVSGGNVSALTGIANNSGILQFNAPIGSGSSGGPILDCSGLVVGLVKAVLRNDLDHAPIAQNINFGVKAALIRSFLHAAGVVPTFGAGAAPRSRSEVARDARAYLYLVTVQY